MDDTRIEWMKGKLEISIKALENPSVFEEFITRNDGKNEVDLQSFLNNSSSDGGSAILFFVADKEEEEEIEVEIGIKHLGEGLFLVDIQAV